VPAKQTREMSTFSMSRALKNNHSARRAIATDDICEFLENLVKTVSPLETLSPQAEVFRSLIYSNLCS
jgi:hypothetical protein